MPDILRTTAPASGSRRVDYRIESDSAATVLTAASATPAASAALTASTTSATAGSTVATTASAAAVGSTFAAAAAPAAPAATTSIFTASAAAVAERLEHLTTLRIIQLAVTIGVELLDHLLATFLVVTTAPSTPATSPAAAATPLGKSFLLFWGEKRPQLLDVSFLGFAALG